jgi:HD-like signal output (HDOD) protein/ActR/RegA family two-component response regulator
MRKRVLFVEDDPPLLHALERAFQSIGAEWDMGFVENAVAALELMDKERFDVLVSDLHMPGMDGTKLLNEAGQKHPNIIRFILAESSEKEQVMTQVLGAHQFLAKPCEAGVLKAAIQCALSLDIWLGNRKLQELVGRIRTFPTLPSLYFEVMRELNSINASTDKIGEIISRDLSMTTKMLRMLNSAYFGLSRQITDPSEAVGFLGLETVKSLVLAIQVFSQYDNVKPLFFSIDRLWKHSTLIARSARQIARWETGDDELSDNAYTAGLLHDMGRLVLAFNFDEQYHNVQSLARRQQTPLWEVEKQIFGASHAEVGAYLIGLWGLPLDILEAAALHHHPQKSARHVFTSLTAVHAANAIHYERRPDKEGFIAPLIDMEYLASIGLADRVTAWRENLVEEGAPPVEGAHPSDAPKSARVSHAVAVSAPAPAEAAPGRGATGWKPLAYASAAIATGCIAVMVYLNRSSAPSGGTGADGESSPSAVPGETAAALASPSNTTAADQAPATSTPVVATSDPAPPASTPANAAPDKPVETVFPSLKVQGIMYSPAKPKAIINGQTVTINDQIDGAKVLSIGPMTVIIQFEGKTKILNQE